MKPIILIGGGGHCISCIDVIESTNKYKIMGILDTPEKVGQTILNYPVIGTDDHIVQLLSECSDFLITVGQINSSVIRQKIFNKVTSLGGNLPIIISPLAHVSKHANIDKGTIVMHHALINANVSIGRACIINSKSLIEHESEIGNFCHISTGTVINGQVIVDDYCFIGSNTVVSNNTKISANVIISAGSKILENIELAGTYSDHPLRKIR